MLSMTIKRITQEYIKAAINTANVVEKQIQELVEQRMYSAEYLEKEKTKIEEVGSVALDMLRSRAINGLSVAFDTARAAIENSMAESANTTEIEELKTFWKHPAAISASSRLVLFWISWPARIGVCEC